jgi:hypothetical protein
VPLPTQMSIPACVGANEVPKRDSVEIKDEVAVSRIAPVRNGVVFDLITAYPVVLVRRLLGRKVFGALDWVLLQSLVSVLPDRARRIVQAQIAETNYASTIHYGEKSETILHKIRPFLIILNRSKAFEFSNEVVILATAKFMCKGKRFVVDFVVVSNVLAIIEYNKSTKDIFGETHIEIVDFDLDQISVDEFGRAIPDQST